MFENFNINAKRGLSGCKLELTDTNSVIKISSSYNYNLRLMNQKSKQDYFSKNFLLNNISTPSILSTGFSESMFYFEMEYVSGVSPFEFFLNSDKSQIDFFFNRISNYISNIKKESNICKSFELKKILTNKLETLEEKTEFKKLILFLKNKINSLDKDTVISFCHGDLTLSNMIYKSEKIFLIDFLDSFFNSYLVDLVKLKQDLFYLWSIKNDEIFTDQEILKIIQVSKYLWKKIEEKYYDCINNDIFDILDCINFLRIEPYINDLKIKKNFYNIISKTKIYEEFNNSYGGTFKQISGNKT